MTVLQSDRGVGFMRGAAETMFRTLVKSKNAVKPETGRSDIDGITERYRRGAASTFVNGEGLLRKCLRLEKLKNGDNVGTVMDGLDGVSAKAFPHGKAGAEMQKLLKFTERALCKGIGETGDTNSCSEMSGLIQFYGESYGYKVVHDYVGHGIGEKMHEDPQIPNYGSAARSPRLKSGMALPAEPVINLGTHEMKTLDDKWTVFTKDCKSLTAALQHGIQRPGI